MTGDAVGIGDLQIQLINEALGRHIGAADAGAVMMRLIR